MDLTMISQDLELESSGIWAPYRGTDFECQIARIGNPKFEESAREKRQREKIKSLTSGSMDDKTMSDQLASMAEMVADHILVGWRGLTNEGKELAYSREEAIKLLKRRDMRDWYLWVLEVANDSELYRRTIQGEDLDS